jgi:hypothetical protein
MTKKFEPNKLLNINIDIKELIFPASYILKYAKKLKLIIKKDEYSNNYKENSKKFVFI